MTEGRPDEHRQAQEAGRSDRSRALRDRARALRDRSRATRTHTTAEAACDASGARQVRLGNLATNQEAGDDTDRNEDSSLHALPLPDKPPSETALEITPEFASQSAEEKGEEEAGAQKSGDQAEQVAQLQNELKKMSHLLSVSMSQCK